MDFRCPRRNKRLADSLLDLTPLIDVVFLLLIFFLITTTFVRNQESLVPINLPQGPSEVITPEEEQLSILVDQQGSFYLSTSDDERGHPVDDVALENELRTIFQTNPDLIIFLRGDRAVDYGRIMDVFLLARQIGFERVHAVIREQDGQPTDQSP